MATTEWGRQTEQMAMSISVDEDQYKVGEEILLHVATKNVGDQPVAIVVRSPWVDFTLLVRDASGKGIPKNSFGQQRTESGMQGRRLTKELAPGATHADDLEFSRGFHVSVPGEYHVVATRPVYRRGRTDEVTKLTSNAVTIRIVSGD